MRLFDIRLDLDLRCNFRCAYCPTQRQGPIVAPTFSLDSLKQIFPILNKYCWNVYLSCAGEPTLHPHFKKIMALIPKLLPDTDVFLITNGWNLTEEACAAIVSSGISRIFCSIDTVEPKLYQNVTGTRMNGLERVKANIENIITMRGKRRFPTVTITSVVAKKTLLGLPAVADWAMKAGVDCYKLLWLLPCDGTDMGPDQVPENNSLVRKTFKHVDDIVSRHGKIIDYPLMLKSRKAASIIKSMAFIRNKTEYLVSSAKKFIRGRGQNHCAFLGLSLLLKNDGMLYLCPTADYPIVNLIQNPEMNLKKEVTLKLSATQEDRKLNCPGCNYYRI